MKSQTLSQKAQRQVEMEHFELQHIKFRLHLRVLQKTSKKIKEKSKQVLQKLNVPTINIQFLTKLFCLFRFVMYIYINLMAVVMIYVQQKKKKKKEYTHRWIQFIHNHLQQIAISQPLHNFRIIGIHMVISSNKSHQDLCIMRNE